MLEDRDYMRPPDDFRPRLSFTVALVAVLKSRIPILR
jgi:hypothetical protein